MLNSGWLDMELIAYYMNAGMVAADNMRLSLVQSTGNSYVTVMNTLQVCVRAGSYTR